MSTYKTLLWVSTCLAGALAFSPAYAAESADASAATGPAVVGEVVVTAERRAASAQKVPQAITVLGGDSLRQASIVDTKTLLNAVPGLSIAQTSANSNLGIRGLASGGGNAFADPAVSFNVNGVTLGRPFGAGVAAFYDVARVEILKGPQGTLYGRNATVGAINVVPNRPVHTFGGALAVTVGNYNQFETTGALNVPVSDQLAIRGAFQTIKHKGYLNNGLNDANNYAARFGAAWDPSDKFSLYVSADYFKDHSNGAGTIYLYPNGFDNSRYQNPKDPWETLLQVGCATPALCPTFGLTALAPPAVEPIASLPVIGRDAHQDNSVLILSAELTWRLNFATLTVQPAHVDTNVDFINYGQGFRQLVQNKINQDSLEIRLASDNDSRLKWLVGGYAFHERQFGFSNFTNPRYFAVVNTKPLTDTNFAAFGQATYSLTDAFRLTAGLRYTTEEKRQTGTANGAPVDANPLTPECNATSLAAGAVELGVTAISPVGGCNFPSIGKARFNDTSFRVGVEFDLAADSLLFANVSSAFKAGGFFIGLAPNTYEPEKLTAYQVGLKNRFLHRRLLVNIEGFYWDYKDQQIAVFSALNPPQLTSPRPFNVPGNIYGSELNVDWLVTDNDQVKLDVLWEKGKYDIFPTAASPFGIIGGLVDAPRANVPEWSATFAYNHTFDLQQLGQLTLGGQIHYESNTSLSPNNIPGSRRPSFRVIDFNATYVVPNGNWKIAAFVKNIDNEPVLYAGTSGLIAPALLYRPRSNPNAPYAAIGAPRTVGVKVMTTF